MDLKQFITEALVDIIQAIDEVRNILDKHSDSICPLISPVYAAKTRIEYDAARCLFLQEVDFDIAVSAETKDSGGGKARINVMGISASCGADTNQINASVSRIKFHVPIGFKAAKQSTV